jgi:hypothetical protein
LSRHAAGACSPGASLQKELLKGLLMKSIPLKTAKNPRNGNNNLACNDLRKIAGKFSQNRNLYEPLLARKPCFQ